MIEVTRRHLYFDASRGLTTPEGAERFYTVKAVVRELEGLASGDMVLLEMHVEEDTEGFHAGKFRFTLKAGVGIALRIHNHCRFPLSIDDGRPEKPSWIS